VSHKKRSDRPWEVRGTTDTGYKETLRLGKLTWQKRKGGLKQKKNTPLRKEESHPRGEEFKKSAKRNDCNNLRQVKKHRLYRKGKIKTLKQNRKREKEVLGKGDERKGGVPGQKEDERMGGRNRGGGEARKRLKENNG